MTPTADTAPLRDTIDWAPLQPGEGARFRSHSLQRAGLSFEWQRTGPAKFAALGSIVLGMLLLVAFFPAAAYLAGWKLALLVAAGLGLAGVGLYFFQQLARPLTFDRESELFHYDSQAQPIAFHEIAAVQLLSHVVEQVGARGNQAPYGCYELNVVHWNGTRTRVVGHADRETLRREGPDLARFLGVEYWDRTSDHSA